MIMVTMGAVWDRTTEVLSGRAGMLAGIAVPALFLPTIVRDAFVAYGTPGSASFAAIGGLLSLVVVLISIWGQLALIAASSDPNTDRTAAIGIANNRFLPAIGVSIVMAVAICATLIPLFALVGFSGLDFTAMAAGKQPSMAGVNGGALAGAALFMMVWAVALLFVGARLAIWQPVLVNERLGLRSIARAWRLTRGATWRIVGVLILFGIVLVVATLAAQSIVGIVFRLILGADNIATARFLGTLAGSAVSTVFVVLAVVFTTQLYVALAAAKSSREPRPA
ncbi:hypothetical protein [Sphingomonas oligophenolica]|uniref:Glycerophosphoryl diester phosphodiesterase membrane domain-containing protein n=1 Tax=Sphingomonas oligophenolica TaxID=301154 RepID=A0A502CS97_9SPHN|nr:hypothetical protein [Sphingomonas oligophenolica]TPG15400.1 hypothetical protein EAH84_00905 [Sphingomonas oligophenolica]